MASITKVTLICDNCGSIAVVDGRGGQYAGSGHGWSQDLPFLDGSSDRVSDRKSPLTHDFCPGCVRAAYSAVFDALNARKRSPASV